MDSSSVLKKSDARLLLSKHNRITIWAHTPESPSFHKDQRLTLIVHCCHVPNCVSKLTLTQRNVGISIACACQSCLRSSCVAIPRALTGWCYGEAVSNYVPTVSGASSAASSCGIPLWRQPLSRLQSADSRAAYLHSDYARSSVTLSRTGAISVVVARVVPRQVLFAGEGARLSTPFLTGC